MSQNDNKKLTKENGFTSLSVKVAQLIIICAFILGVVMLLIGLGLYSVAVANQYIATAFSLSRSASKVLSVNEQADAVALCEKVMDRYKNLSEEELEKVETEEYEELFADIDNGEDYQTTREVLRYFLESSDVDDIYLGMYDGERNALVYFADPADEDVYLPGYWESVPAVETKKFLSWNGIGTPYDISYMKKYGWMCSAGYPLKNEMGETVGFVLADITLSGFVPKLIGFSMYYAVASVILVVLLGWFLVRYMNRKMVQPINSIARAAQTYVSDKTKSGHKNNHFAELKINTGDEIEKLAGSMSDMETEIVEYEENLTKVTAEKQRIGTELALATRIQADMLPNIFPAFPERNEFTIYASMTPAKEVGGDFYDFFFVDQDKLAIVIADVSGKGIPAAMFMMMAKSMLQTQAAAGRNPGLVLETVNRLICENNREEMFVTVWFAVVDLETGILTAANAGHEFPVLKKKDGNFELYKDPHGLVIGGMDGMKYKEYEIKMEPGDKIFVYTDGVAEATNLDKELFGMERTVQALNKAMDQQPEEILKSVNEAIDEFVGEAEQFDDLTMVCFEYKGK